jgi:hypothetical protein
MNLILVLLLLMVIVMVVRRAEGRQRIDLLGSHLKKFRIETRMEQLTEAYLRALGERDEARAEPVWQNLVATEQALRTELQQLAADLQPVWGEHMRVSRWPVGLPYATRLFPQASFDFRALVTLHAQAFADALDNAQGLDRRDRAFRATAELLLFQHSCHWFCRSKNVASARLLARHHTRYQQVLQAVSPNTLAAYQQLVNGPGR